MVVPLFAQDKYWSGGAGTNDWSHSDNWSPTGVPDQTHWVRIGTNAEVIIPSDYTARAKRLDVWYDNSHLTIAENAKLELKAGTSNGRLNLSGENALVTNNGTIEIADADHYGILMYQNPRLVNNGTINMHNLGNLAGIEMNPGRIENNGILTIDSTSGTADGIYQIGASVFHNYGEVTITKTAGDGISSSGFFHNRGIVTIFEMTKNEPMIEAEVGMLFYNYPDGTVAGYGEIHHAAFVDSGGMISPGLSIGLIRFEGGDEYFTKGTIEIEIAGTAGANRQGGHDKVEVVSGTAIFDAAFTIEVRLLNGFVPASGDQFIIMSFVNRQLEPTFDLPNLPAGLGWSVEISETQITLSAMALLPVLITHFKAWQEQYHVLLHWATASEFQNKGFAVEHSSDGSNWTAVGFVPGKGDASEISDYRYIHAVPIPGTNYYHLRQTDYDGRESISQVVSVMFGHQGGFSLYPNPATDWLNVSFQHDGPSDHTTLRLMNLHGQLLHIEYLDGNDQNFRLDLSHLQPGVYFLVLEVDGQVVHREKVVRQ